MKRETKKKAANILIIILALIACVLIIVLLRMVKQNRALEAQYRARLEQYEMDQKYMTVFKDKLTFYIDGKKIDPNQINLSSYSYIFTDDKSEVYLSRKFSQQE